MHRKVINKKQVSIKFGWAGINLSRRAMHKNGHVIPALVDAPSAIYLRGCTFADQLHVNRDVMYFLDWSVSLSVIMTSYVGKSSLQPML